MLNGPQLRSIERPGQQAQFTVSGFTSNSSLKRLIVPKPFRKQLRFFVRSFWGTVVLGVMVIAACVQLGRAVFPILDDYRASVGHFLSDQVGAEVEIGTIDARWRGLRPHITLLNVVLRDEEQETIFIVERVELQIGLLATLYDWRVALRKLRFHGLQANLLQSDEGHWSIGGLAPAAGEGGDFALDDPLDIFLFGRRIELRDTALEVHFRSGLQAQVRIPEISLENDDYFHRLAAAFWIDGKQAMQLVVEGRGDPRNARTFDASGYLQLNEFPTGRVLAALEGFDAVDDYTDLTGQDAGLLGLELWFNGTTQKGIEIKGSLHSDGFPAPSISAVDWPKKIDSRFTGSWHSRNGWRLALRDARVIWDELQTPVVNLELRGNLGEPVRLGFDRLEVAQWARMLAGTGWLPKILTDWQQHLQPAGILKQAEVTLTDRDSGYFNLRAFVENGQIQAWRGAPAVEGVDGFVNMSAFGGTLALRSEHGFTLGLPRLYPAPLAFAAARGSLRWTVNMEDKVAYIGSNLLQLQYEQASAEGRLHLTLPFDFAAGDGMQMSLLLEASGCERQACIGYIPEVVPEAVSEWIAQSVHSGHARDIAFLFHGALMAPPGAERVVELALGFTDAEVTFHPEWPVVTEASGQLVLENGELTLSEGQGKVGELQAHEVQVTLLKEDEGAEGRVLRVQGHAIADSDEALRLVRETPLHAVLSHLSSWQMSGPMRGELDLQMPLFGSKTEFEQTVDLALDDNLLHLPDIGLTLAQLSGELRYSSVNGVYSDGLQAQLWDQPVTAAITTEGTEQQTVRTTFAGRGDTGHLRAWLGRPELALVDGAADITGELLFPLGTHAPLQIHVFSDLTDVAIDLPPPFAKEKGSALPLTAQISRFRAEEGREQPVDFRLTLGDRFDVAMRRQSGALEGISVAIGGQAVMPQAPIVDVRGRLERVDVSAWSQIFRTYRPQGGGTDAGTAAAELRQMPVHLDLAVEELALADFSFRQLHLTGGDDAEGWKINAVGEHLAAQLRVYNNDRPLTLDFSRLRLPDRLAAQDADQQEPAADRASSDGPANWNLDWLPPVDFNVDRLELGEADFGAWTMKMRPLAGGVSVHDLWGSIRGLIITGRAGAGAELLWLRSPLGQQTYFTGVAKTGDLAHISSAWGQPRAITSDSAVFDLQAQWPGAPHQIALTELSGLLTLDIERGRFMRGASVGENPLLKLIGLLNFDTLARRLRLDFSDLRPEGMGYERVRGGLQFRQGTISMEPPIKVETPSTDLQIAGEIDTHQQLVDARMVVTLPVAGNLTVAAALVGGLPLAVGVFLAGKVFKSQVDRVSSLRYRIQGDWNEPRIKLDKVFKSDTD